MAGNQEVRCSVQSCRYNDKSNYCTLSDIEIGETNYDAQRKRDTECGSFEAEV